MQKSNRNGVILTMKISKVEKNITIKPTEKKIKKAKQFLSKTGILPNSLPIEQKIRINPMSEKIARIKDQIQISIEKMRGY